MNSYKFRSCIFDGDGTPVCAALLGSVFFILGVGERDYHSQRAIDGFDASVAQAWV